MKNTCFLSILAAALMGGQVFAEPTETAVEGYEKVQGSNYYGKYSEDGDATGGKVTIKADPLGEVPNNATVYGGWSKNRNHSDNNTVVMSGGTVSNVYGGSCSNMFGTASNNVVVVTGGTITNTLIVSSALDGTAMNNKLHLVGKGANNVSIADAQGKTSAYSYTGETAGISLAAVIVGNAGRGTSQGNSVDIYGTGIGITGSYQFEKMQILTFNITDGQVMEQTTEAALTLTSAYVSLNLTGVELQVNDLDVKAWTPGKTITLVEAAKEIQGLSDPKEVNIMRGDQVMAVGTLALAGEGKLLQLTVQGSVPEPTTGSLSLLALAGLCARRRRK